MQRSIKFPPLGPQGPCSGGGGLARGYGSSSQVGRHLAGRLTRRCRLARWVGGVGAVAQAGNAPSNARCCSSHLLPLQLLSYSTPARQLADDELLTAEFDQEYFDRLGQPVWLPVAQLCCWVGLVGLAAASWTRSRRPRRRGAQHSCCPTPAMQEVRGAESEGCTPPPLHRL